MGELVVNGALLSCSFGLTPSPLTVLPMPMVTAGGMPVAKITDAAPIVNIKPFELCLTLSNPEVAALTAAALGVFTPAPCMPVTEVWAPGSPVVTVGELPAVTSTCKCVCAWGGVITVDEPGQFVAEAPP